MTSAQSRRSYAPIMAVHLARLSALAAADHSCFTRAAGRPEYRERRVAVVLAQGAALHYADGRSGVKDFDVWSFYAALPGQRFPADRRETHADFGVSEFGRQLYELQEARSEREATRWRGWQRYGGRRVDFLMRALPIAPDAGTDEVIDSLQHWLALGARSRASHKPSPWHLAQKAVALIEPAHCRGRLIWPHAHHG